MRGSLTRVPPRLARGTAANPCMREKQDDACREQRYEPIGDAHDRLAVMLQRAFDALVEQEDQRPRRDRDAPGPHGHAASHPLPRALDQCGVSLPGHLKPLALAHSLMKRVANVSADFPAAASAASFM